jgi:hypothetical protein
MKETLFFQLALTPLQIQTLNITSVRIRLESFSGRAELYVSQKNRNPGYMTGYDQSSSSMEGLLFLDVDLKSVTDLWSWRLFIGVYAAETTNFALTVDAEYVPLYPLA